MSELFAAQVGFEVVLGTGWFRLIQESAIWPLSRLSIDKTSLRISIPVMGTIVEIPWESVSSIEGTWAGIEVQYHHEEQYRELCLYAPFLWSRFESKLTQLRLAVSALWTQSPKTNAVLRDDVY